MNCCAAHRAIKTTAKGLLFSPVKHMCRAFGRAPGSVWQGTPPSSYPPTPQIHPEGCYMAAFQCFLYAFCLAKHLEPMSRTGLAKCHAAFFRRTVVHAPMPKQ